MNSKKFWLKKKYWFTEKEIDLYQKLTNGDLSKIKDAYVSTGFYTAIRPYHDDFSWHPIIHNKWITKNYYQSLGIKMPETYGLLHKSHGITISGEKLQSAKDLDELVLKNNLNEIVIKHIGGGAGNNVFIINKINKNSHSYEYITVSKQKLNHKKIDQILSKELGGLEGYLVEEKLTHHPSINEITGGGLASIRTETLFNGKDVNKIQMAFLRLGINGRATDHSTRNGIYVPIDVESGVLGKGLDFKESMHGRWVSRHSVTNKIFEGVSVPDWEDICKIALDTAKKSPGLRFVGWDIVITKDGPRLLEGNVGSTTTILGQQLYGGYLENGVFDEWIDALDIPRPDSSLSWKIKHWDKGRRLNPFEQFISSILSR